MATLLIWTFIYNLLVPQTSNIESMDYKESKLKNSKDIFVIESKNIQNETYILNEANVHEAVNLNNGMASSSKDGLGDHGNEKMSLLQISNNEVCTIKIFTITLWYFDFNYLLENDFWVHNIVSK